MMTESRDIRLLIIEDDKSWQEIWAEMLGPEGEGYNVILAADCEGAIANLAVPQFALVIVDLMLPQSSQKPEPTFQHTEAVIDYIASMNLKPRVMVVTGKEEIPLDITRRWGELSIVVASKLESLDDLLRKVRQLIPQHHRYIVMKFGGTSMGTPESIGAVADIIARYMRKASVPCTVVVSAMSKTTDSLLMGA